MLELDDPEKSERVADWVELELSLGEPNFSKSKLTSIVRDSSGVEPSEAFVSDVWQLLRRRHGLYSSRFFDLRGDLLERCDDVLDGRLEYEVCLMFSLYGASAQTGADPKLFERLSAEAIRRYMDGHVFVFGWPVLPDVEADIAARVRQASDALRERFVEAPAVRYKDRGVDIICWRPFFEPDQTARRAGQLVVLAQCAAGRDWRRKTTELPMASWTQYIHWAADPIPAFTAPAVIVDDLWHDVAREVRGLVFDRVRLVNNLSQGVQDAALRTALQTWRDEQIEEHRS